MTAMTPIYCASPTKRKNQYGVCGKEANGGMVVVDNRIYPLCKDCWEFGYKIRQMIVNWPKKVK